MRKIIIAMLIFSAGLFNLQAQDYIYISGQITDIDSGDPIPNHEVFINLNDSLGFFMYLTDQQGYYGDTIVTGGIYVEYVHIYTFDCTWTMHDTTVTTFNNPIVADFEICNDPVGGDCQAAFFYIPDSTDWLTIYFRDMSITPDGSIDFWAWEFGDGNTSSEQHPAHTYASTGVFTVCLTIEETSSNCESTFCMEVIVENWPGGDCWNNFTATTNDYLTYTFTGEVFPPTNATYEWDFGDGTYGTGQNVTHTFDPVGGIQYYLVCLTTFSIDSIGDSCMAVSCQEIWVGNQLDCQAMYWARPDSGLYTFQFMDMSWGNPDSWLWDFGDGYTSTEQNPYHTYEEEGTYQVCLTIEGDSCTDTFCDSLWVGYWPGDCLASFYFYPDSTNYYTFQFVDMSFTPSGNIDSWSWEFGDGTTSSEQNPVHSYNASGEFTVCLTIYDSLSNCENTFCMEVWVYGPEDCEAAYFYFPMDSMGGIIDPLTLQFIDISMGYPTSWSWDFGDGTTSTEQNPMHTFSDYGTYFVCLTIANDSCTDTFCDSVYVIEWPSGDCFSWFNFDVDDMTVDFEGYTYSQFPTTYTWDFGDGSDSLAGQNVTHTYEENGIYVVTLTTIDSTGCTWISMMDVWVGEMEFDITGFVYVEYGFADDANVYLMTFDTLSNNLVTVDTTQVGDNGYYIFEDVQVDNWRIYYIQAELTDQSIYYGEYMPTYHYAALTWQDAWPVFPMPVGIGYDIFMMAGDGINSGGGMITGTVHSGETRGVIDGVEMLLFSENDDPLTYIRTDEEGLFDFSQLALGTYKVHTEMVGIYATPIIITLTEDNQEVDINIIVNNGTAVLGVQDNISTYLEEAGDIFPNPVDEQAQIEITLLQPSDINIMVYNNVGQLVHNTSESGYSGKNLYRVNTSSLQNGFYTLRVMTEDGANVIRKFVKL